MSGETDAQVQAQYEQFPYPHRDPADEAKRLIVGSPSHLDEIRHYLHGGRLDLERPFRALVAGGGTGDATIMLAQQLVDAGAADAQVTYLDLSTASRAVAEARAEARGLSNIRFVTGTIEQIGAIAPGPYDHIDCCGVLHHLASPEGGLQALKTQLSEDGGMGLMVYGTLGRTGVYAIQEALAQLARQPTGPRPLGCSPQAFGRSPGEPLAQTQSVRGGSSEGRCGGAV
jgi:2-polyprenyl-3-methyl-5-hydroxy-6-metoxy-1,4-benzoquinol methylase